MPWRWLPWRFFVRRAARRHGFLDPLLLMARLERFAQPSEVSEPIELLRAGVHFHARGLINTRVIQHNLDWVWPWWIERQFDPRDEAFLPRAFSFTHVNLTHRNWTAVGLPDHAALPIVDPRGLVTPFHDSWSLDAWVIGSDDERLYPARSGRSNQRMEIDQGLALITETVDTRLGLREVARVEERDGEPVLCLDYRAHSTTGGYLAVALRPYNPEGVSLVHDIALSDDRRTWSVDGGTGPRFSEPVDEHAGSDYRHGDVALQLDRSTLHARCHAGLATAAALFALEPGTTRGISAELPLEPEARPVLRQGGWRETLAGAAELRVPDTRYRFLYEGALRTLLLHSVDDIYPGPFTYRRFWFRDASLILNALLLVGYLERSRRHLDGFPRRQNAATGYFHSQEGEWDSNGQVLWIMARYAELSGEGLPRAWLSSVRRGGRWIHGKRTSKHSGALHAGLLPAGFSAEHFGPNDCYYWDDFWAVGGLRATLPWLRAQRENETAASFEHEADDLEACVRRCLDSDARRLGAPLMPASPHRRMDSGAVGSLAAGYPLQLVPADDPALLGTVNYLYDHTLVHGGFFQDMIHSGVNAYLTLHMAQVLLRAGDRRCVELMDAVADLASPTGQWPEAIHPRTFGGCMGDGQHVWAAAEWVAMLRNVFLREEGDVLVLAGGVPRRWLRQREPLVFGPGPTCFGPVRVEINPDGAGGGLLRWQAEWRRRPERIRVIGSDGSHRDLDPEDGEASLPARHSA